MSVYFLSENVGNLPAVLIFVKSSQGVLYTVDSVEVEPPLVNTEMLHCGIMGPPNPYHRHLYIWAGVNFSLVVNSTEQSPI